MRGCFWVMSLSAGLVGASCGAQVMVQEMPSTTAKAFEFRDSHFKVKFEVPPGWDFTTKDGEVSRFHADVSTVPTGFALRGVASMNFNPYPHSTLGGAMFYFSVGAKAKEDECKPQSSGQGDVQDIGGMKFVHSHGQNGEICTEVRDEVYTAYRKGSCYRFDLEINTFCAQSSGAQEITDSQLQDIVQRMTGILSTVELGWEKGGPHPVPAPQMPVSGPAAPVQPTMPPKAVTPAAQGVS